MPSQADTRVPDMLLLCTQSAICASEVILL